MMVEVFSSPDMPFYKFGDLMFLEKISPEYWIPFIKSRFKETGKKISSESAQRIAILTENHPYYVQQLAQLCWFRTEFECSDKIIEVSFDSLINQLSMLFQTSTDTLNNNQLNILRAILNGVTQLSSKETINEYHLGTSANVTKTKKALILKEIIDQSNNEYYLLDPVYKQWLKQYFGIS